MATNTFTALYSNTLTSTASSVTISLSGITGYDDLVLVINAKNTVNAANCKYQLNSDTTSNYSTTWFEGSGTTATSGREPSGTSAFLYYNGNASTYNWSTVIARFYDYASTTKQKTVIARFGNGNQVGT